MKNAVCVIVDRLHTGHLGCYGASWADTPAINHLASASLVCDSMLINSAKLEDFYSGFLGGAHPLASQGSQDASRFIEQLKSQNVRCILLTDSSNVANLPHVNLFDEIDLVAPSAEMQTAATMEETRFAKLFSRAAERLSNLTQPFFFLIHAASLNHAWDAPREYRLRRVEEGDREPPNFVSPPHTQLSDGFDPDAVLGVSQSYSAEIAVLDECLGGLVELMEASELGRNSLFLLTAPRGVALGEHGRIGGWDNVLHSELVHTPCMIRHPEGRGAMARTRALTQTADLHATLCEWWNVEPIPGAARSLWPLAEDDEEPSRDRVLVVSDSERGLRTPGWYLRSFQNSTTGELSRQLYAKPDDRSEVNDVANRCGDIADVMEKAADDYSSWLKQGASGLAPPLDPRLLDDMR